MSKRNRKSPKKYEREGINSLVEYMKNMRPKPLPQIDPTSYKLEEAIVKLPRTLREPLEKFFGLLPGKINHYQVMVKSKKSPDLASYQMELRAQGSIKKLLSLDYLRTYDNNFERLCNNFMSKIDNSSNLEESVALKYLLVYFIILLDGSNLFFDSNEENNPDLYKYDNVMALDTYAILNGAWKSLSSIEDNSFNINLVVEWVESLELSQKAKVLQSVDLDIPYSLRDYASNVPPHFIDQIRQLKENIFSRGPWRIVERLVFEDTANEFDYSELAKLICSNPNWVTATFQTSGNSKLRLSSGTQELEVYKLGDLQFTDPSELDFLYLERGILNF